MRTLSYSAARQNLASTLDSVVDDAEPVIVTRSGHEPVVMMSLVEYESLSTSAYLMRSPANAARLHAAVESLEAGRGQVRDLAEVE